MNNAFKLYSISFVYLMFPTIFFGQVVDLGTSENFIMFTANGAVSNSGVSNLTGDIGSDLGSISGFGTSTVSGSFYNADAVAAQAKNDVINAYNQLATFPATVISHAPAFGGGEVLAAGVYDIAGAGSLAGNLKLDGLGDPCAVFIFRFGGAFAVGAASSIILTNGAQACNIYFVAEGAISIAASTNMKGTLLANNAAVSVASNCNIEGRLLSTTGAIAFGPATGIIPTLFTCSSYSPTPVLSCNKPDFRGAINFVAFTSNGAITNSGHSDFSGHIGSNLGIISGFGTSSVNGAFYNSDAITVKTKNDVTNLYNQLIQYPKTDSLHAPAFGSGEILTKGIYDVTGAGSLGGIVTLDAENDSNAVFVFRFGGAFAAGAASDIKLINSASSCRVFWVAEGAISVGAGSNMIGTFLANNGAVTTAANCQLEGKLFSTGGAINLDIINADNSASCQMSDDCAVTSVWHGTVSVDWFDDNNWDAGTPDSNVNAIIPVGPTNMPIISSPDATCKNLNVNAAADVSVSGTNEISIYGDWTVNGTFNCISGTVFLKGATTGNKINMASNQSLNNLVIANESFSTITFGGIELTGMLDIISGIFNTNNLLTLISDSSGTARINELPFKSTYILEMTDSWSDDWNGGYISVFVDGISVGNFSAIGSNSTNQFTAAVGSTVRLDYVAGDFENENSYVLKDGSGNVLFSDSLTPISGIGVYTTIADFVSPIVGSITMQRYIDAGATNWRFLTSAVAGTTIADFNDDFITSGFTGSNFPFWPSSANPWVSIHYYDETVVGDLDYGFTPATNVTNPLLVGQGIWVWCGDNLAGTQPFTIDMQGDANVGVVNLPISYTDLGSPNDDGWNMVGNPYPSSIDWDTGITKVAIDDAIYVWNPDLSQFTSYVDGIGVNGGSNKIASSQAFWVHATSALKSVQISEGSKIPDDAPFLKQIPTYLTIEAINVNGRDEAIVNFNANASLGFNANYDAFKIASAEPQRPSVSTLIGDSVALSINQLPNQGAAIPLKVTSSTNGLHQINFLGLSNFSNASCILLEDLFTGEIYDLTISNSISVTVSDTTSIARFLIKIGAETSTSVVNESCYFLNDGSITITRNSPYPFDITWKDDQNNTLLSQVNVFGSDSMSNINAGTYFIEINDNVCGIISETIVLTEPLEIVAEFDVNSEIIDLSQDGVVNFINHSNNASYYEWDFGDFNYSTQVSPVHQYLQTGVIIAKLFAYQTPMCYKSIYKNITVIDIASTIENQKENNKIKSWIINNTLNISSINQYDRVEVLNLLGQELFNSTKNQKIILFDLSSLSSQILIVRAFIDDKSYLSKIEYIKN